VTLGLIPSDAGLLCLQAGVVAAPRALEPRLGAWLGRMRGPAWALIPVVSIVGVIFAIRSASATAGWLTWLALIAVPLLSIAALGWLVHGSRRVLLLAVPVLFLLAWRSPGSLIGEGAAALLSGLSCVSLGVLLGGVTPERWLKLGIVAMAVADVWLISANTLQAPNGVLIAAAPGGGLPQLQSEQWGSVTLGYGDLFVAGLLGAVWSARPRVQWRVALLTLLLAAAFDVVFNLAQNDLPATVPVALAMLVSDLFVWGSRFSSGGTRGRSGPFRGDLGPPGAPTPVPRRGA
jgi:hypothetical protein